MSRDVFVLALVGDSPGVVTELLWHLVAVQDRRVVGLELWCTEKAAAGLALRGPGLFRRLGNALEGRMAQLPAWDPAAPRATGHEDPTCTGITVIVPLDDGAPLQDVASDRQARCFGGALEQRLERLRSALGDTQMVASLAGGRKGMSAALHAAFTLQAREGDELVHVMLDPRVEASLTRGELEHFACPTEPLCGIVPEDQVVVYQVPFVPVADLVAFNRQAPKGLHKTLCDRWRRGSHDALGDGKLRVVKSRTGKDVDLSLGRFSVRQGRAAAAYLAVLLGVPGKALGPKEILARLDAYAIDRPWWTDNHKSLPRTLNNIMDRFAEAGWYEIAAAASLVPQHTYRSKRWGVHIHPGVDVSELTLTKLQEIFPDGTFSTGSARRGAVPGKTAI